MTRTMWAAWIGFTVGAWLIAIICVQIFHYALRPGGVCG